MDDSFFNLYYRPEVDSTNEWAKELARSGAPEGTLVVADTQRAGRGRRGRTWSSPRGGLYFSLILRPSIPPELAPQLVLLTATCLHRVLRRRHLPVSLKWPNDVVARGDKLAGILVEAGSASRGLSFAVVGVGVNVNGPPPLEGATSIETITASPQRKDQILQDILGEIKAGYLAYLKEGIEPILADYRQGCTTLGREVVIFGSHGKAKAKAIDVGNSGELLVEYPDGCRGWIHADEVSLRIR